MDCQLHFPVVLEIPPASSLHLIKVSCSLLERLKVRLCLQEREGLRLNQLLVALDQNQGVDYLGLFHFSLAMISRAAESVPVYTI